MYRAAITGPSSKVGPFVGDRWKCGRDRGIAQSRCYIRTFHPSAFSPFSAQNVRTASQCKHSVKKHLRVGFLFVIIYLSVPKSHSLDETASGWDTTSRSSSRCRQTERIIVLSQDRLLYECFSKRRKVISRATYLVQQTKAWRRHDRRVGNECCWFGLCLVLTFVHFSFIHSFIHTRNSQPFPSTSFTYYNSIIGYSYDTIISYI